MTMLLTQMKQEKIFYPPQREQYFDDVSNDYIQLMDISHCGTCSSQILLDDNVVSRIMYCVTS